MILTLTATLTGLMAGLFFAWSCSVTLGLAKLPDTAYISAMQSLNRAIQNPLFFACFFGTAILLPFAAYMNYKTPLPGRFWFLLAAAATYLLGVMGVTILGNIPLNEALDKFNVQSASIEQIATQRAKFELPWNKLNTIRTIASTASLVLVILACLHKSND